MSNQMDAYLAEAYGTAGTAVSANEDQQKVAQQTLFAKLAADNGIDLDTLTDDQVKSLWDHTFAKAAAEEEKNKGKAVDPQEEEKKAEALAYEAWSKTKEAEVAWQQADRAGRQMAHAYVHEMRKIASDGGLEFLGISKAAEFPPQFMKKKDDGDKDDKAKGEEKKEEKGEKKEEKKEAAAPAAPVALDHNAELSKIAAKIAYQMGVKEGFDKEVLAQRLGAVLTLDLVPATNTKVASATDFEVAKQIRALELLEAAGYPVTWTG